jgi:hypothetical protein
MAVYVDPMMPWPRTKKWPYDEACHLFADSETELIVFARSIGLRIQWIQRNPRLLHFDLTANKRRQAVLAGAIEVNQRFVHLFMEKSNEKTPRKLAGQAQVPPTKKRCRPISYLKTPLILPARFVNRPWPSACSYGDASSTWNPVKILTAKKCSLLKRKDN